MLLRSYLQKRDGFCYRFSWASSSVRTKYILRAYPQSLQKARPAIYPFAVYVQGSCKHGDKSCCMNFGLFGVARLVDMSTSHCGEIWVQARAASTTSIAPFRCSINVQSASDACMKCGISECLTIYRLGFALLICRKPFFIACMYARANRSGHMLPLQSFKRIETWRIFLLFGSLCVCGIFVQLHIHLLPSRYHFLSVLSARQTCHGLCSNFVIFPSFDVQVWRGSFAFGSNHDRMSCTI